MPLEICVYCVGDSLSSKQLNRSSEALLSPPFLAHKRFMQKQACEEAAQKEGQRIPKVHGKGVQTSKPRPSNGSADVYLRMCSTHRDF